MHTSSRLAWVLLPALAVLVGVAGGQAPPDSEAEAEPVTIPIEAIMPYVPDASWGVELYDRPSDDGSALMLVWPVPEIPEPAGADTEGDADAEITPDEETEAATEEEDAAKIGYVVEIAPSPEDFGTDRAKTIEVAPKPDAQKDANPKYFGFSSKNANFYFAEIIPSDIFKPPSPWTKRLQDAFPPEIPLGPASLSGVAEEIVRQALERRVWLAHRRDEGLLTQSELEHALAAWPLLDHFNRAVAAVRAQAELDKEVADEAEAKASGERLVIELAIQAGTADATQTPEALAEAQAAEDKARAEAEAAAHRVEWSEENVRSMLTSQQQRELDWVARLDDHFAKRDKDLLDDFNRQFNGRAYYVRLGVKGGEHIVYVERDGEPLVLASAATTDLFSWFRLNNLIFALVFSAIVLAFIQIARRNPNLFVRKIAGLDAVEEAIGRATEMGRPAFFIHGYGGPGSMSVIAALNILSRVSRQAADYDTRVRVMNIDPIVTAVSQEVVQQAYIEAGRPDAFDSDDVAYMTNEQFSYAAAVAGRMVREQPAAIFLIGYFMAESLLLAETGTSTGAIQVAGTDAEHQLPFFITTCDYTLIGEELYAASAYLSREPRMLGSLSGQDIGKAFMMAAIVIGVILVTIFGAIDNTAGITWIRQLFEAIS